MRDGIPPGQTPNVPPGPGLVFYDTLRMNWKSGTWNGPKYHIEVFLDSPEYFNLLGSLEARQKYFVMSANITE